MKSIYLELLNLSGDQMAFQAINFDGFYPDEDDDYEEPEEDDTVDDNLLFLPLERTFLCVGEEQFDVSDLQFAYMNFTLKDRTLEKYDDGDLYKEYPIAVSFLMDRADYMRILPKLSTEDLSVASYTNGTSHSFEDGVEIMDIGAGDSVRIVMGFAKEGIPHGSSLDSK